MKNRLISIVLIMSFCISNIGNASSLDATLLAVLHSWLPNMNAEVFDSLVEDTWEDELIEAVVAQTHYQKKLCYFYGRVPCKNGNNCKFRHEDRDMGRVRKQNLAKYQESKKKKEPLKILLKDEVTQEEVAQPAGFAEPAGFGPVGGESGSGIEIFVTENGQLLEPTISQPKRCHYSHNQNHCKKKGKPRQRQPLVINTSPLASSLAVNQPPVITPWASIISPAGYVFNVYYSYHPHTGTHLICHDARFWDFVRAIIPSHILVNNVCRVDLTSGSIVEIGGAAAHYFMSRYS